jgi:uncharacterized protein YecE (DUF72 family)
MSMYIGCSGLPAKRQKYFENYNAVEILPAQEIPPRPSTAKPWRAEAPEGFAFSMVASRFFALRPEQLPPGLKGDASKYGGFQLSDELMDLHARTIAAAEAFQAQTLVFVTPSQVSPSPRSKEALYRFFEQVERGSLRFIWEPHGPWEHGEIAKVCSDLNLIHAIDPLRDELPPEGPVYARLGPFAVMGRAMAEDELEVIHEALSEGDDAWCFFNTERAQRDAQRLRQLWAS